jgi:hypothetical protein
MVAAVRQWVITGPALVLVKGNIYVPGEGNVDQPSMWELGLALDDIRVSLYPRHKNILVDDFGPDIPADVMAQMCDATIAMKLSHYAEDVLDQCFNMANGTKGNGTVHGILNGAGVLLGGGANLHDPYYSYTSISSSGNSFISLNIEGFGEGEDAYRLQFPSSFLQGPSPVIPIGAKHCLPDLLWRAVPYAPPTLSGEIIGSGAILYLKELAAGAAANTWSQFLAESNNPFDDEDN